MPATRSVTDVDRHVAARMRERKDVLGLTLEDIAVVAGTSWQQVQKRMQGRNRLSADALWTMAVVLQVDIGWFFEGLVADKGPGV